VIKLDKAKFLKMHCDGNNPTYKAVKGVDLNSSAFYTALKIGLDQKIVKRAQEISAGYGKKRVTKFEDSSEEIPFENFPKRTELRNSAITSDKAVKEIFSEITNKEIFQIKKLKENKIPSLSSVGDSVLYILKTPNNFFYVGETDNFAHRVKSHRSRLASNECVFFYVNIKQGKSEARKLEQKLITKLKNNGFPMLSVSDASNANFGT
jgi:predicted GIY-YIG superfamily endonuclease